MRKILLVTSTAIVMLVSSALYANEDITCPNANAIKQVGLNHAEVVPRGKWLATHRPANNYGTDVKWTFTMLSPVDPKDVVNTTDEAYAAANLALHSLEFVSKETVGDSTICGYKSASNTINFAVTPPFGSKS